jgi:S-adenosylmethionine uptake transporter
MSLGALSSPVVAICIKTGAADLSDSMVIFLRAVLGLPVFVIFLFFLPKEAFYIRQPFHHILFGLIAFLSVFLFFYTLPRLPVANAVVLHHMVPVFIPFFAWLFLRQDLKKLHLLLLLAGFAGVYLVSEPGHWNGTFTICLIGVASAILAAFNTVHGKFLLSKNHPLSLTLTKVLALLVFSSLWVAISGTWQRPDASAVLYMMIAGCVANLSSFWAVLALKEATPSYYGVLVYLAIPISALSGYLFLGESLSMLSNLGIVLLSMCILSFSLMERRVQKLNPLQSRE